MSYYLPALEIGRLAAALRFSRGDGGRSSGHSQGTPRRARRGGAGINSGDKNVLTDDSDVLDRASGTGDETRWRRRSRSNRDDDGGGRILGRASPPLSIGRAGGESEDGGVESGYDSSGDSERYGKRERRSHGSASGSGSGRAWARGNRRDDGLEGLTRQVGPVQFLICVVRVSGALNCVVRYLRT